MKKPVARKSNIHRRMGVVYLLTHPQLAARLIVSLYSLRRWYDGPVVLFTTRRSSHEIGELCAQDRRLGVDHRHLTECRGHIYQSAYLTKAWLTQSGPFPVNLFLDADTVISGPLSELVDASRDSELAVTGFGMFSTPDQPVLGRLHLWRQVADRVPSGFPFLARIHELTTHPHPAINAGIFTFHQNQPFARRWHQLARIGREMPLPDEMALQLILPDTAHVYLGHRFNCHPRHFHPAVGANIWHFAGRTHLWPECRPVWLPLFQQCFRERVARIDDWSRIEIPQEL